MGSVGQEQQDSQGFGTRIGSELWQLRLLNDLPTKVLKYPPK